MDREAQHISFLRRLAEVITTDIAGSCFTPDGELTWVRRWGWKADVIDLDARPNGLFINFYIYVPTLGATEIDDDFTSLAVRGLGLIGGSTDARLSYPSLLFGFSSAAKKVAMKVVSGLQWFDPFATPGGCMEYLREGRGVNASPASRACAQYLSSLPDYLEDHCCLLNVSVDRPSEGFARLFVVGRADSGRADSG
jgi:hypothetical protein